MFNRQTWKDFILTHPDLAAIETGSKDLVVVLRSSHEPVAEGDKLMHLMAIKSSPATVLISLNPFNDKIMGSFHHEPFGIRFNSPTVNGHVKCIALTGFGDQATPVYIDTDRIFMATETAHPSPTLQQMLSFHDREPSDLTDLIADLENLRVINLVGVLPPSLSHIIIDQDDGDHPQVLLLRAIKAVYAMIDESDPENTEEVEHLYPLLLTIWGFCNHGTINDLYTANAAATDNPALTWLSDKHKKCLQPIINVDDKQTQISAIDRLASTIEASNSARFLAATSTISPERSTASSKDTETSGGEDDLIKAWNKIPGVFRQGILFASSEDGASAPAYPSEKLLALVHCKNGATATRLLARWHANLDLTIQAGMALNITRGMVCSQPDPMAIDTFSPFFCPPTRAGFNNISNDELNSLELSSQSFNLSQKDIHKMTKCKPFIPRMETDTIDMIINYQAINGDIFGDNSIGAHQIQDIIDHYNLNKMKYHRCFETNQWFGLWLVNRIHYKHQSYLHSCFFADDFQDIALNHYSLMQEIDSIDSLSFQADPPTWSLPLIATFNDTTRSKGYSPSSPRRLTLTSSPTNTRYRSLHSNTESPPKRSKIQNNVQDPDTIIQPSERYASLVHFRNLEKCKEKAVKVNDTFICNNWHIRGNCHNNCRRSATHSPLTAEVKNQYREYVAALRQCQTDFATQSGTRNRSNTPRNRYNGTQGERN